MRCMQCSLVKLTQKIDNNDLLCVRETDDDDDDDDDDNVDDVDYSDV